LRLAYRIVKARNARAAFSGEGARRAGGRWNLPGDRVVYASSSLALAAMETFVHLGEDGLHIKFVSFSVEIPATVTVRRCPHPPRGWRAEPPREESMRYGSAWLRSGRNAVLQVPSAVVPSEWNFLLNPDHPDFRKLRVSRPQPFSFDPRMWK
jgi:RES domain-containing protein